MHNLLWRHKWKENLSAAGHSSAYADGYLSRIIPERCGSAVVGRGMGRRMDCRNRFHCSQTI